MSAPVRLGQRLGRRLGQRLGRPLAVAPLAMVLALALVAGCGVPLDSHPRPISEPTVPTTDIPPTTIASSGAQHVSVYFLRGDRLEEEQYPVPGDPSLGAALTFVLAGPASGSSSSLRTAVPPGTQLRHVSIANGVARIDLTSAMNDISGETQKQAFAQLVFTALAFRHVHRVRFLIAGKGVDAPTDKGNLTHVTADDYVAPLNPR